jgi:rfaE bifunctional protein kinase chain/domain
MTFKSPEEVFEAFKKLKVLIIGDVMVDAYIHGKVNRISPEAPVPVVSVSRREKRLGGAANVALNVQSLGATPILCSIIGDDPAATDFLQLMRARDMKTNGIIRSRHRITTVKNRVIAGGHHLIRIDEELDQPLEAIDLGSLKSHISQLINECDVVVFEDYDKGCIEETLIQHTIKVAGQLNKPVAVDPKKRNFLSYKGSTLFKPNLKELQEGIKLEVNPDQLQELDNAVEALRAALHFQQVMIALSEHGVYFNEDGKSAKYPAHIRSIADVSGAGDTVISIASLCLALELPLGFTSELANLGGGIVCEYSGVVPINAPRLLEESRQNAILSKYFSR